MIFDPHLRSSIHSALRNSVTAQQRHCASATIAQQILDPRSSSSILDPQRTAQQRHRATASLRQRHYATAPPRNSITARERNCARAPQKRHRAIAQQRHCATAPIPTAPPHRRVTEATPRWSTIGANHWRERAIRKEHAAPSRRSATVRGSVTTQQCHSATASRRNSTTAQERRYTWTPWGRSATPRTIAQERHRATGHRAIASPNNGTTAQHHHRTTAPAAQRK